MEPTPAPSRNPLVDSFLACFPDLKGAAPEAALKIIGVSEYLASQIDAFNPNDTHGRFKLGHMERVLRELDSLKVRYSEVFKDDAVIAAYMLASIGHDVGRMAIRRDQLTQGQAHTGGIQAHGARTLFEIGSILDAMDPQIGFLAKVVIRWHDMPETPTTTEVSSEFAGELSAVGPNHGVDCALGLLALFRDRDRINILQDGVRYVTPDFMLEELLNWQIGGNNRRNCPWQDRNGIDQHGLPRFVGFPATGEENANPPISSAQLNSEKASAMETLTRLCQLSNLRASEDEWHNSQNQYLTPEMIKRALFGPEDGPVINPLTLSAVQSQKLGTKSQVTYSYVSYIVYAVQYLFRLEHNRSVREVGDSNLLSPWIEFVRTNAPANEFDPILHSVEDFVQQRIKS